METGLENTKEKRPALMSMFISEFVFVQTGTHFWSE